MSSHGPKNVSGQKPEEKKAQNLELFLAFLPRHRFRNSIYDASRALLNS